MCFKNSVEDEYVIQVDFRPYRGPTGGTNLLAYYHFRFDSSATPHGALCIRNPDRRNVGYGVVCVTVGSCVFLVLTSRVVGNKPNNIHSIALNCILRIHGAGSVFCYRYNPAWTVRIQT